MSKIERGLSAIPDVTLARVNLTDRRVALEWKQGTLDPARFIDRLAELGYKAYPFETAGAEAAEAEQSRFLLRCLGVAAFATMNVMMLSIPVWSGNGSDMIPEQRDFFHWLSALIALPAAAYAGQPFFRSAFRALRTGNVNMDVPISIGVILALGDVGGRDRQPRRAYLFRRGDHAADVPAGRALSRPEHAAANPGGRRKSRRAEGRDRDQVHRRRRNLASAGRRDPSRRHRAAAAGRALRGRRHGDRRTIRDRPEPDHRRNPVRHGRSRAPPVYAGSLNISGTLRVRVSAASEGTLLAEITRLLDNALQARSRYVRLADRASRLYAPVVHATALLTMLGWVLVGASWHDAIVTGVAVLIITCPCALGLAIPTVQTVASGAMFRAGVLLNSGDSIERLAEVDCVIFDKTGTLTLPDLEVVNAAGIPADVFGLAGQLALASHHPVAAAVAQAAGAKSPLGRAPSKCPGRACAATLGETEIRLGRPSFCGAEQLANAARDLDPEASLVAFSLGEAKYVFAGAPGAAPGRAGDDFGAAEAQHPG